MNVSHKNRFVWTAPPKVGSRTVRDIFKKHCDLNPHWPSEDHSSDFTHANIWPDGVDDDYLHITLVRHPYYRWLSYWKYAQNGLNELKRVDVDPLTAILEMDFGWFQAWTSYGISVNTNPRIDYVIHAETIEEDIRLLPFMPDDYVLDVPSVGRTSIPKGYTWDESQLREEVYKRFKVDYDKLGYDKWDNYDHLWDSKPRIIKTPNFPIR